VKTIVQRDGSNEIVAVAIEPSRRALREGFE
jgi:hypothetical protein